MATHEEVNASATLIIRVECEMCPELFTYRQVISSGWKEAQFSQTVEEVEDECKKDVRKQLDAYLQRKEVKCLGFRKCPQCSHIQSWMRAAREEHSIKVFTSISIALSIAWLFGAPRFTMNVWYWVSIPGAILVVVLWRFLAKRKTWSIGTLESQSRPASSGGPLEVNVGRRFEVMVRRSGDD